MDARSIRTRLEGHGDVTAHRDGSFTLRLERPVGEFWYERMRRAVREEVPGAVIRHSGSRPSTWRAREIHEVVFDLGTAGGTRKGKEAA